MWYVNARIENVEAYVGGWRYVHQFSNEYANSTILTPLIIRAIDPRLRSTSSLGGFKARFCHYCRNLGIHM